MVRLTIRATDESVPPVLMQLMEERLSVGASTVPELKEGPTPTLTPTLSTDPSDVLTGQVKMENVRVPDYD